MDTLGVNLQVFGFESYASSMNQAKALGVNTAEAVQKSLKGIDISAISTPLEKTASQFQTTTNKMKSNLDSVGQALKAVATTDNKGNTLDWMEKAVARTKLEITSLRGQIRGLEKEAAASQVQNSIFNKYEYDAHQLNKELSLAELKLKQLDGIRGKQTTPTSTGFSPAFKDLANTLTSSAISAAGIPPEIEKAALASKELLGVSTATLGIYGGIVLAGAAFVRYSINAREEAEKRLKLEEKISYEYGQQVKAFLDLPKNTQLQRGDANINRYLSSEASLDELKSRRNLLQQFFDWSPSEERKNKLLEIDSLIYAKRQELASKADQASAQRWETYKKNQEERVKAEEQASEKFQKSVEQGLKQVQDFGKTVTGIFDNVYTKFYSDNPIALAMIEGDRATKQLQESLKGLPPQLQEIGKEAFEMQEKINSRKTFEATLNNRLEVSNLRALAESFRNPKNPELDKKFFDSIVNRNINGLGSDSTGEIYRKSFGSDLAFRAGGADKLTADQKRSIYEVSLLSGNLLNSTGTTFDQLNQNSLISTLARERLTIDNPHISLQEKLQRQLDTITNTGIRNEEQLGIADRKALALAQNYDPANLSDYQRNLLAGAAEREADRKSKLETKTLEIQEKMTETHNAMTDELEKLRTIVEKLGKDGIPVDINVKDDTSDKKVSNVTKRPDSEDTTTYYSLNGNKK